MKKLLLVVAMVTVGFTANAQKSGLNVGADVAYHFNAEMFAVMAEANYLFDVAEGFRAGPIASYFYTFGKSTTIGTGEYKVTVDVPGSGAFNAGAAGRYDLSDILVLGLDLGYTFKGEVFTLRPLLGYKLNENMMVQASYPTTINGGGVLALGFMFGL